MTALILVSQILDLVNALVGMANRGQREDFGLFPVSHKTEEKARVTFMGDKMIR